MLPPPSDAGKKPCPSHQTGSSQDKDYVSSFRQLPEDRDCVPLPLPPDWGSSKVEPGFPPSDWGQGLCLLPPESPGLQLRLCLGKYLGGMKGLKRSPPSVSPSKDHSNFNVHPTLVSPASVSSPPRWILPSLGQLESGRRRY